MKANIYLGDCMEAMAKMKPKQYSLGLVDPPYGLGDKLTSGGTWSVKWQNKGAEWDRLPTKEYFDLLFEKTENWMIWGGNYFIEFLPNCRNFIAWHKPYMDGMHSMSNVELALTSFDKNAKKVSLNKDLGTDERIHVTQKPVALYKWLLKNYAKEGDTILDTHGGSMSSVIACIDMGFDIDCYEMDVDYYKAARKRIENHVQQLPIFGPPPIINFHD